MPELLSPAGSFDALKAAVSAGADAVYLGATTFSARASAANFDENTMPQAIRYAHSAGVKILVTVNTLILPGEMENAVRLVETLRDAGADGLIIQDMGLAAELYRRFGSSVPMNASTQATVHNLPGVLEMARRGFRRVVLARELALTDLESLCSASPIELETFAHGALCVSCSGACLMSSMIGNRSGNRGRCAQPCRLPYTMEADGQQIADGTLLSPKDLMTLPFLAELCRIGIASLKIEGRLKRPEYVTLTTRAYRRALDAIAELGHFEPTPDDIDKLMRIYNRGGFTRAYFFGTDDANLMNPVQSGHTGVEVGRILNAASGLAELKEPLRTGDGLQIRPGGEGFAWNAPELPAGKRRLGSLPRGTVNGAVLFKTTDAKLMEEAFTDGTYPRRPMKATIRLIPNELPRLTLEADGLTVSVIGEEPVQAARNRALEVADVRKQLEKTDTYPWTLSELTVETENAFVPVSSLNQLRRQGLESLLNALLKARSPLWTREPQPIGAPVAIKAFTPVKTELTAKVMTEQQAEAALQAGILDLSILPEDFSRLPDLAALRKGRNIKLGLALPLWMPDHSLAFVEKSIKDTNADYLLVPNLGSALYFKQRGYTVRTDFSLNVGNAYTLASLKDAGFDRITLSAELTCAQARETAGADSHLCETIVYGSLPLMHLIHCPFRAQMKLPGTGEGCHACKESQFMLRDRMGAAFPIRHIRLERCQQLVFNSVPTDTAHLGDRLPRVGSWRMDFVQESPREITEIVQRYTAALAGETVSASDTPHTAGHWTRSVE